MDAFAGVLWIGMSLVTALAGQFAIAFGCLLIAAAFLAIAELQSN